VITAGTTITAVTAEAMLIPTITAVMAVTAGPRPPSELHAVAPRAHARIDTDMLHLRITCTHLARS
jgi:hypothetical protein